MERIFDSVHLATASELLSRGEPPLFLQLLILNTLIMIVWVFRRARGAPSMRPATANTVQTLLLVANCVVLMNANNKFIDFYGFFNIFS